MDFGLFRGIKGDTILSPTLPRLGIQISPDFIYLGKLHYISAGTYHVEQFILLSPNGLGHVTRVLLVQFAGILENKAGVYEYPHHKTIQMEGEEYRYEERCINIDGFIKRSPRTELAHAADYIRQRAYTLAGEMHYQRFTRLVSADMRNEFVITYLDISQEGTTSKGTPSKAESTGALNRARSSFRIVEYDAVE